MIKNRRAFWLNICLVNLCIVALLGFLLRSKILFPLPFLDYRNLLSSHSHFAFSGWAGLALISLLIYDILPESFSQLKIYQWILAGNRGRKTGKGRCVDGKTWIAKKRGKLFENCKVGM